MLERQQPGLLNPHNVPGILNPIGSSVRGALQPAHQFQPTIEWFFADKGAGEVDTLNTYGAEATFTRATTATTVLADGLIGSVASGTPRSYYDPTTLVYLGYLAEGARTNLCLQSEDVGTTWIVNAVTSLNSTVAPDGTTTADTITDDSAVAFLSAAQAFTVANDSLTHVFSVFVKKTSGGTSATFGVNLAYTGGTPTSDTPRWNTDTGEVLSGDATSQSFTNYWRFTAALANNGTGNTTLTVTMYPATNTYGLANDSAAATGSAVVWGMQLEKAAFASSYIPTTTVAVARNADVLTYPTTGWLSATAGTMYGQGIGFGSVTGHFMNISDGTADNRNTIARIGDAENVATFDAAVAQANFASAAWTNNVSAKVSYAYAANDFAGAFNGTIFGTDASGTIPVGLTELDVGQFVDNTLSFYGPIRRMQYFNRRLPDGALQALTA